MTEVTRVPLQPIAKGSLTKLWLGIIALVLVGGVLACSALPRTLDLETIVAGEGDFAGDGDMIFIKYKGSLASNGEVFDESQDIPLPVEGVFPEGTPFPLEEGASIPGFYEGLKKVQAGGKYKLYIPSDLAYGSEPPPSAPIPANADLIFDIEVIDIMDRETFDRNLMILQQAMQPAVAGPEGAPEVTPPTAPSGQ